METRALSPATWFLFLLAATAVGAVSEINVKSHLLKSSQPVTVLLAAFNSSALGMSELHYIRQATIGESIFTLDYCDFAATGRLYNATSNKSYSIVSVLTGEGPTKAGLCTNSLMMYLDAQGVFVEQIIWVGTSGWSSVVGGLLPSKDAAGGGAGCSPIPSSTRTIAVGSMCVNGASLDYSCLTCTTEQSTDNVCRRPSCAADGGLNGTSASMDPTCNFLTLNAHVPGSSRTLAEHVLDFTSRNPDFAPSMPMELQNLSAAWWAANEVAPAGQRNPPVLPSVNVNCVEADDREIWVGPDNDFLCRERTAQVLNADLYVKTGVSGTFTSQDVICVAAMEGIGFMTVMRNRHEKGLRTPPYAIVRAASNYNSYPVRQKYPGVPSKDDVWELATNYTSAAKHGELLVHGYRYAIHTSNTLALAYLLW